MSGQTPATTPTPTNTAVPLICPPNLPDEMAAGSLHLLNVTVTVPAGRFSILEEPPGSGDVLVSYQASAGVSLSSSDCTELGRYTTSEGENAILDQIAASCTLDAASSTPNATSVANATPIPSITLTSTPTSGGILPPDTGDGGLRN